MPDAPARVSRLAWLDGVRALAALWVLLHHAYMTHYHHWGHPPGLTGVLTNWLAYGEFAVPVFIVVSGYSLMLPVTRNAGRLRGGVRAFASHRFRRIVPTYWLAIGVAVVLSATVIGERTGTHWDLALPLTASGAAASALLVNDLPLGRLGLDVGPMPNYVFWSIAVEVQIYLAFPFLLAAFRRWGWRRPSLLVVIAATVGAVLAGSGLLSALHGLHPELYGNFALGCVAAVVTQEVRDGKPWAARVPWLGVATASAAVVVGLQVVLGRAHARDFQLEMFLVVGIAAAALFVHAGTRGGRTARTLAAGPLPRIGFFAYSIYLVHAPLEQVVWKFVVNPLDLGASGALLVQLAMTPVVVAACYGFFLVAERPFLRPPQRAVVESQAA